MKDKDIFFQFLAQGLKVSSLMRSLRARSKVNASPGGERESPRAAGISLEQLGLSHWLRAGFWECRQGTDNTGKDSGSGPGKWMAENTPPSDAGAGGSRSLEKTMGSADLRGAQFVKRSFSRWFREQSSADIFKSRPPKE